MNKKSQFLSGFTVQILIPKKNFVLFGLNGVVNFFGFSTEIVCRLKK